MNITEHHQYLFLGKVTNSLTEPEEKELRDLFQNNKDAVKAFEQLVKELPQQGVAGSFDYLNSTGFWKDVPAEIYHDQQIIKRRKVLKIAGIATLVIGAAIGFGVFQKKEPVNNIKVIAAAENPKVVELKLANGKTINLTTTIGHLDAEGISIQNTDQTLSYKTNGEIAGINTVTVPVGMDYKINLSDGSTVWLNSTTILNFPSRFAADKRQISIEGEAYIEVAPNADKPFVVNLPGNLVKVLGTSFNVNTYNKNIVRVALVKGAVSVSSEKHTVKLKPGTESLSTKDSINVVAAQTQKILSWREGKMYFDKAGLEELSAAIQRWFGVRTIIDDPALVDKRFAGVLDKNMPLSSFLDNFQAISKIGSYFDKEGVLHFK